MLKLAPLLIYTSPETPKRRFQLELKSGSVHHLPPVEAQDHPSFHPDVEPALTSLACYPISLSLFLLERHNTRQKTSKVETHRISHSITQKELTGSNTNAM